jgi:alpha-L-fucosidase 2
MNNFMNIKAVFSIFALTISQPLFAAEKYLASETTIWFDAPATNFTESSPLGNGRLGAMMFGAVF